MTKRTTEVPEGLPLPNALKELQTPPRKMRFFWQGDPGWGHDQLGEGTSSMGGGGCLVTSLTMLAMYFGTKNTSLTPGQANIDMRKASAFIEGKSDLVMHRGAAVLGLEAPAEDRLKSYWGDPALKKLLLDTIALGDAAIIHVSTDGDPKDGGEHFIAAFKIEGDCIVCADPALGRPVFIPLSTMSLKVMWRDKEKLYQIVSVAPVRVAA